MDKSLTKIYLTFDLRCYLQRLSNTTKIIEIIQITDNIFDQYLQIKIFLGLFSHKKYEICLTPHDFKPREAKKIKLNINK